MSFTLSEAYTDTYVEYDIDPNRAQLELTFSFHGKTHAAFEDKIRKFFMANPDDFPYINQLKINISSQNSFPHSAGIASSASSMSALALCLVHMEQKVYESSLGQAQLFTRASHLARLASGSASRSVYGGLVCWGETEWVTGSSDYYAVPISQGVDPVFLSFENTILMVDKGEKPVSSTAGHALMNKHPYAEMRYYVARDHVNQFSEALANGDIAAFGRLLENEALALHGLMMNSDPSFILLKPNTLSIIEAIREVRDSEDFPWYFTLDAGPNVHVMYPHEVATQARKYIETRLQPFVQDNGILYDRVGQGPSALVWPS